MFKEFSNNEKEDDYLSEFRQKIATQNREDIEERRHELQRSRNGFIGTLAGIVLAALVSWFLLIPRFSQNEVTELPIIRRPITPTKIQPNEPGGMEILNEDKSVYNLVEKKVTEPEKIESLLPPPESPKLPVIVPEPEKTTPQTDSLPKTDENSLTSKTADSVTDPQELDPLKVKPLKEKIVEVDSTLGQKIKIPEKLPAIVVEAKTIGKTSENQSQASKTTPETTTTAKKTPAKQEAPDLANTNIWQVQLMASSHKSSLEKGWRELTAKHGILKQYTYAIETTETGDKVIYRLKAGAFKDRQGADKLCAAIKKGGGSCLVKKKEPLRKR